MADTTQINDITTATPEQIDSRLALLTTILTRTYRTIDQELDKARRSFGEYPMRSSRTTTVWRTTDEQIRERLALRAKSANENTQSIYNEANIHQTVIKADQTVITTNDEIAALEAEYDRRHWSRYFIVTSSHGHIHNSRTCHTCTTTTTYGWLPQLSGRTMAEAVQAHGPLLCSVCFPGAPLDWTQKPARSHCSGTKPKTGTTRSWGGGRHIVAECPDCGRCVDIKANGQLKKHQPLKTN